MAVLPTTTLGILKEAATTWNTHFQRGILSFQIMAYPRNRSSVMNMRSKPSNSLVDQHGGFLALNVTVSEGFGVTGQRTALMTTLLAYLESRVLELHHTRQPKPDIGTMGSTTCTSIITWIWLEIEYKQSALQMVFLISMRPQAPPQIQ